MADTMKIRLYFLLFLFGWVHNQAYGRCSTKNMNQSNVIQFCSGSNITNRTIILNTAASTGVTNCICHFTVLEETEVNISGICPTKIQFYFSHNPTAARNACEDFFQHMTTNDTLQFTYSNDNNSKNSYCNVLQTNKGELKGTCFDESFIPTTETSATWTSMVTKTSSTTDQNSTNGYESTTSAVTTTKGTTAPVTTANGTTTAVTTAKGTTIVSSSKTTHKSTTNGHKNIPTNGNTTAALTTKTTVVFDSTTDESPTVAFTNAYQDSLQLMIIIIVSVLAIVSTLIIIKVAFCLRNRRLKKQEQSRPPNFSANPSFDEAEDSGDEMVYNELYHSRIINRGQMNPECDGVGDKEEITPHRHTHYNIATMSKANDSGFQSQNGNSSVNSASMKNENPSLNQTDDSGDEMVYNELYHSRNVNRGHMVSAYCDYKDVTPERDINPNKRQMSDFQSENDNSSVYAISAKHKKSNEVMVNSEPVYALPDKKKKQKSDGDAVYSLPERKNKKKRQETKLESSEFGIKNDKENNILW